jgi:hypothetical protein
MNSSPKSTLIARAIGFCIGIALLITFIALKIWKTTNLKGWMTFGAIIGLCIGYGLGGDIWGARLFDLFTGRNSRQLVGRPTPRLSKMTLFILVGLFVFLLALFIRVLIYNRHTTP